MFSIRFVIGATLLLHGLAHVVAALPLVSQLLNGVNDARFTVESWLFPSLSPESAALVALPFWIVAFIGFVLAAFWFFTDGTWRSVAVVAAIVSMLGLVLFSGVWPGSQSTLQAVINLALALTVNTAVLITQLVLHWPATTH